MTASPLRISAELALPLDFVTSTQAILAKKGSGKSYTASVIAEEMLEAKQQIVVVDPTGAWFGLRSSATGKGPGYPIAVFGGEHGDVALEPTAGEVIADAIASEHFSAVLDLSLLRKGEGNRFMGAFLETLYRKNRDALHLFIDEADVYAPQRPFGDEARTLGACEDIVRRGRIRGIGCTLITQRPQVLSKNVLSQVDTLTALRMNHPKDLAAIREWVAVHGDEDQAKQMLVDLPSLPIGNAWIWAPAADLFERVAIRRRRTFDSGATPKTGKRAAAPRELAHVDIARLGAAISATVERQKAADPRALRARVAELEAKLTARPTEPAPDPRAWTRLADTLGAIERALAPVSDHMRDVLREVAAVKQSIGGRSHVTKEWAADGPRARAAAIVGKHRTESSSVEVGNGGLRRILTALAQRPAGLTNRAIGVRAGLSSKGGTFSTYLSRAKSAGWIETPIRGGAVITPAGRSALGAFDPLPTGRALGEHWLAELGNSGAARILRVLIDAYPKSLSNAEVGERADISAAGGSFSTYVSRLRSLELVVRDVGALRASEELFE